MVAEILVSALILFSPKVKSLVPTVSLTAKRRNLHTVGVQVIEWIGIKSLPGAHGIHCSHCPYLAARVETLSSPVSTPHRLFFIFLFIEVKLTCNISFRDTT